MNKEYLGDAVYVEWDGLGVKLTTEDGIRATNIIVMEDYVLENFADWLKRLKETIAAPAPPVEHSEEDHTSDSEPDDLQT